jgi:hypothetical protein
LEHADEGSRSRWTLYPISAAVPDQRRRLVFISRAFPLLLLAIGAPNRPSVRESVAASCPKTNPAAVTAAATERQDYSTESILSAISSGSLLDHVKVPVPKPGVHRLGVQDVQDPCLARGRLELHGQHFTR